MPHAALLLAALAPGLQPPAGELAAPDALHVAVVLDDSGSMLEGMPGSGRDKMGVAKGALSEVFAALPDGARVGLFALNSRLADPPDDASPHRLLPIAPHDRAEVDAILSEIQPGGGTPLGARLAEAAAALRAERAARKYGDYRLLVVTDGEATDRAVLDAAVPTVLGAGLTVDVIGVAMAGDHALATRVDRYRRADDPESLRDALREVLAESAGDGGSDVGDAGAESDYDLLAPLPDGAASVALAALAAAEDAAAVDPPADSDFAPPAGGAPAPPADVDLGELFAEEEEPGAAETFLGFLCCCGLPLLAAGLLAFAGFKLLGGGGGGKRRRRSLKKMSDLFDD